MQLRIITVLIPVLAAPVFATSGPDTPGFDNLVRQGRAAFLTSDLNRAEAAYSQACAGEFTGTLPVAKAVTCENLLASVDEARGNLARAEQRYLQAVSGAEQAGPAYRPLHCARLIDLGEFYRRQRKTTEAEAVLLKARDLARSLISSEPQLLPEALIRLGGLYSDSGQPERGRAPLEEALKIIRESPDRLPAVETARAHSQLGMIELAAGHLREADSQLRESLDIASKEFGEDHPVTAAHEANLAAALIAERQFDRAWPLLRRAEFIVKSASGVRGSELAVICAEISQVASMEDKTALAEDYAMRALSILNEQPHPDSRTLAMANVTLAGIYIRAHEIATAESILPGAVEMERAAGAGPVMLGASVRLLAELRSEQHNWEAADVLYREAIALYQKAASAETNPVVAPLLHALANVLKHEGGSKEEIRALETRARDMQRSPQAVPIPPV